MVPTIFHVDRRPTLGWGQNINIFILQNIVMLHIKSKGIKNAVKW